MKIKVVAASMLLTVLSGCSDREEEKEAEGENIDERVMEMQMESGERTVDLSLIEEKEMEGVSDPDFDYVERLHRADHLDQFDSDNLDVPEHQGDKRAALEKVLEFEGVGQMLEEGYEIFVNESEESVDLYVGEETDPDNPQKNRIVRKEEFEFQYNKTSEQLSKFNKEDMRFKDVSDTEE